MAGSLGRPILIALAMAVAAAHAAAGATLTEAEHAYVAAEGPFSYCVDPDWPPYEEIGSDGHHVGIAADLLRFVTERAGAQLTLVPTRDWDESLAASRDGRCQVLSFLNRSPKRDEWLDFTQPVFIDRNVIVTREDHDYVDDPAALTGHAVALPKGTSIEERLRRDYPNLRVMLTDTEEEAFRAVSTRQADMTIRSLIVAVYTIKSGGWFNLKVAGQVPGYENHLRIGVRRDRPMLRDILDKGVAEITPALRQEIANRHVAIRVEQGLDTGLIARIIGGFSLVLVTSLFWIGRLRRVNRRLREMSQTDGLTGLANRIHMDERLEAEAVRCRRYGSPVSVVLIDLDHFKRVNDEFGHPVGDQVLRQFAEIARRTARTQDLIGRWGGEEFLVLCVETGLDQAQALAERLCQAMREHAFPTGRVQTISVGVSQLARDESVSSMIARADQALYQAKTAGRDRVVRAEAAQA